MNTKEGALIFTVILLLVGIISLFSLYVHSTLFFIQTVTQKKESQFLAYQTQSLARCGIYFCRDCFEALENACKKKGELHFYLGSFASVLKNHALKITSPQENSLCLVAEAQRAKACHSISAFIDKIVESAPTGTLVRYELTAWHTQ